MIRHLFYPGSIFLQKQAFSLRKWDEMNFLLFEGLSASLRDDSETLFGLINSAWPLLPKRRIDTARMFGRNYSTALSWAMSRKGPIAVIGKSKGAGQMFEFLRRSQNLPEVTSKLRLAMMIDPHFALLGDGKIGTYGGILEDIPGIDLPCPMSCIYQRNKSPKGCRWDGADNQDISIVGADHWNITDQWHKAGKHVLREINDILFPREKQ